MIQVLVFEDVTSTCFSEDDTSTCFSVERMSDCCPISVTSLSHLVPESFVRRTRSVPLDHFFLQQLFPFTYCYHVFGFHFVVSICRFPSVRTRPTCVFLLRQENTIYIPSWRPLVRIPQSLVTLGKSAKTINPVTPRSRSPVPVDRVVLKATTPHRFFI